MSNFLSEMWLSLVFPMRTIEPLKKVIVTKGSFGDTVGADAEPEGRFISQHYSNEFGSLHYKLYIPTCYSNQPLPLLVMLHGCMQSADDFATGTRMNALSEEKQCLVIYPEQSASANGAKCWNWFEEHNQQRNQGEPSMIAGIVREVIDAYGIDTSRVFIAGLSAGGAMAVIMGRTYPDLFTAVGSHSGLAYGSANDACSAMEVMKNGATAELLPRANLPRKRIPIIVFHGDRDTTVHPRNGTEIIMHSLMDAMGNDSGDESQIPFQGAVRQGEATGRSYTKTVHLDAAGEIIAEEWIIHGTGHAWSGGNISGTLTDAFGPDAGIEMMRFFLSDQLGAKSKFF